MLWQKETVKTVYGELATGENGISPEEAEKRLVKYGQNVLTEGKKDSFFKKVLLSFADVMTGVLFAAAAVSFTVSKIHGKSTLDAYIILAIVFLNSFISVIQENRAEKALEALKTLTSPTVRVIRSGIETVIDSRLAVPGDVLLFEKGCFIPADCRVTESCALITDESTLTGESQGVYKTVPPIKSGDKHLSSMHNMVWSGTTVTGGHGRGIAVATGMATRMGLIAGMLSETSRQKTPLQKRLAKTSTGLGNAALAICLVIFVFSILKGFPASEMFLTSVSLAVAAIPEGLPAIVTIMLSMGVTDMAKRKAVVKKLPAVETLGCSTVICSDKTGTLTQNKMTVTEWDGDTFLLSKLFALNNRLSSPTEQALYNFAASKIENIEKYRSERPIIAEIPFDSKTKIMITLHKDDNGYLAVLKGAPEEAEKLSDGKFNRKKLTAFANGGLRVIGLGCARLKELPQNLLNIKFMLCGMAGMMDIPRPEAQKAVAQCRRAGIKVVMITGDHKDTAVAVAKMLGIFCDGDTAYTQSELEDMGDVEKERALLSAAVFARSTPEFKVQIIDIYKAHGGVVAMTGDGVNDAPALKKAHIGCAMGKSGTDVAREACDLILTDDNFATIVEAVKAGRGIYANIKRAIHFLISCNIGEIAVVFTAIMLSMPSPLTAVQLLWVNLVTDSLPAIALGFEKTHDDVMDKPPIKPDSGLFTKPEKLLIFMEGLLVGALTLTAYLIGCEISVRAGSTMAFGVLSFSQLFHSFNMRSSKPLICSGMNIPMILAFTASAAAQSAVMLLPALSGIFGVARLSLFNWLTVIGLSASILIAGEISKLLRKRS
ncbi:MAG: cation-translocating P-type ATPase [Eubacteriales bacterium]|nr:cation-translocating P-type ATPase [Eubacteriales bacterium]